MKLEGPVFVLKWGSLLSDYRGGSSVLVEDEVENLYVTVEGSQWSPDASTRVCRSICFYSWSALEQATGFKILVRARETRAPDSL